MEGYELRHEEGLHFNEEKWVVLPTFSLGDVIEVLNQLHILVFNYQL